MKLDDIECSVFSHSCPDGPLHHFMLQCYHAIIGKTQNPKAQYSVNCGKYGIYFSEKTGKMGLKIPKSQK